MRVAPPTVLWAPGLLSSPEKADYPVSGQRKGVPVPVPAENSSSIVAGRRSSEEGTKHFAFAHGAHCGSSALGWDPTPVLPLR